MDTNETVSSPHEDCSKPSRPKRPKKSKRSKKSNSTKSAERTVENTPNWAHLPSVVIAEIFSHLDEKSRKNAASVCHSWRELYFLPRFWPSVRFVIGRDSPGSADFLRNTFAKTVVEAKIGVNSLGPECLLEFVLLLQTLAENKKLRSIVLEPTHCSFARWDCDEWKQVTEMLHTCLPRLSQFSIGCIEELYFCLETIISHLNPSSVTKLGLASVRDNFTEYRTKLFDPVILNPFTKLEVLSIDYDHVSDRLLATLDSATELKKLIVHLHGVDANHPGTTEHAWDTFVTNHPECQLCLTVIHAYRDISELHSKVLKNNMPLTHLKIFFCEEVNLHVIENLPNYSKTLRSIVWVDSLTDADKSLALVRNNIPDPFVLAAWRCQNLEEIVLFGYKYWEENLVAIGRLLGCKLKRLEIAEKDVLKQPGLQGSNASLDISFHMRKPWKPVKLSELHPVICNPVDGDSDEYILPLVLADFH